MSDPFLGEVRMFGFEQAPQGWAQCNGQLLPINQNQALFSLLGTTYGGNGQTTFALPDLRGRVPIHFRSLSMGARGGEESHTLTVQEMAGHNHIVSASSQPGDTLIPTILGSANNAYGPATNLTTLNAASVSSVGGSQPHNNMQPYQVINFCIALIGIFPSRN